MLQTVIRPGRTRSAQFLSFRPLFFRREIV
jgi:hypothetical protein